LKKDSEAIFENQRIESKAVKKNKLLENLLMPGFAMGFLVTIIGIIIGLIGAFGGIFVFN